MINFKIIAILTMITLAGCSHKINACVYDAEALIESSHIAACELNYPLRNVSEKLWDNESIMSFPCEDGAKLHVVLKTGEKEEFPVAYVSTGLGPDNIFASIATENDGVAKITKLSFESFEETCHLEAFLKN